MTKILKRLLLLVLLLLVLVPALQARFKLVKEPSLSGAFVLATRPEFSWESLQSNEFQPALEKYIEERMGFRGFLIQLRNQLRFSVFRVSTNRYAIIGRDNMLYQDAPVNTYLGLDSVKRKEIRRRVRRVMLIQQALAKHNVKFLFVIAPNKARQIPEMLPSDLPPKAGPTNYELFSAELRRQGVELLDTNPLYKTWADTAHYPLFPWNGTHWNPYGVSLVADTLLNRVEHLLGTLVPRLRPVAPPIITDSADAANDDLSAAMNLLLPPKPHVGLYPRMGPAPARPGEQRPHVLLIGDSFNWGLMTFAPYIQHAFAPDTRLWYYGQTVYIPDRHEHKDPAARPVPELDFHKEVESRQLVIVLLTEHNLNTSEFGLGGYLYSLYYPMTEADNARIGQIERELASRLPWDEAGKPDANEKVHQQAVSDYELERKL
jgi:hypothetical protein